MPSLGQGVIVAGIGTDVGKTVASALLCRALEADYWKPVASGSDDSPLDDETIAMLARNPTTRIHPSTYTFTKSLSPHAAAAIDGARIALERLTLPSSERPIVVELAGGLAVPLNDEATNLDLIEKLSLPVVLISRHYLGSINHTLLSLEALRARRVAVAGVLFNGEELPDTERIITKRGKVKSLGRVPILSTVNATSITETLERDATLRKALAGLTTSRETPPT